MFSLGWMEMSIILIICVILVGPKELPVVIKTIKSVILNLKGLSKEFTKTVEETPVPPLFKYKPPSLRI